jgi:CheY-like chemotaxis protein/HPt (histidine-containing phosphotransfer) domain-containing protein
VVDDNATNRKIFKELLTSRQMRPHAVGSGAEALAALGTAAESGEPFELMLLDCMMPEMDGFEVAEKVREDPNLTDTSTLLLPSAGKSGDAARCRELGISTYLVKPVMHTELFEAIARTLRGQAMADEDAPDLITRHTMREDRGSLRILLVEDTVANQRLTTAILEKHGHAVQIANNGLEALEALAQDAFDVVLMDLQMPEMDGITATGRIREGERGSGKHMPIIAMTAHAMKGDEIRVLEAGMDSYISKPFRIAELLDAISKAVSTAVAPTEDAQSGPGSDGSDLERQAALDQVEGDEELLVELVKYILESAPEFLVEIRSALEAGDVPRAKDRAHALKGVLGVLGPNKTIETAVEFESRAADGDRDEITMAYDLLEREVEEFRERLSSFIQGSDLATAG